jgi:hypothetical protein
LSRLPAMPTTTAGDGDERTAWVNTTREQVRQLQRDAIWKWRWLGIRNSTPGFKGAVVILAAAAICLAAGALWL